MVEFQPSKLAVRVRFPSPAPIQGYSSVGRVLVSKTMGRGFESFCPCQKAEVNLRLLFFMAVLNELSPKGSPTARKHSPITRGFTASDTPCFARARHEKQLSTVFPSLTFCPCQNRSRKASVFLFLVCFILYFFVESRNDGIS